MVYAPAFIRLQRTRRPVIPECILLSVRIEFHKHVLKSPRQRALIRPPRILVIADVPEMLFGAVHIQWSRGHVHIAAPDGWFVRQHMLFEILAQTIVPSKLVLILG